MPRRWLSLTMLVILLALHSAAGVGADERWKKWKKKLAGESTSDASVVSGLKEALSVSAENAVDLTGKTDGYFRNEAIKIVMPQTLKKFTKVLRKVGYDDQLDELVLGMNRAAEKAAPLAKDVFWSAIKEMSFDDARGILRGGDTAATDYFRAKTGDRLTAAFSPIVEESMADVGVTKQYKELMAHYENIPFVRSQSVDLEAHVVDGALNGLFKVLGDEERKIRTDPAARVTDLLKDVFGKE